MKRCHAMHRHVRHLAFAALGLLLAGPLHAAEPATQTTETPPYKNPALPFAQRAADLVSRMTLEEKAAQVQMHVVANTRLGIPAMNWWSEAIHGVARAGAGTMYPHAIGMAATWDPPLLQRVASATADEARAKFDPAGARYHGLSLWCPTVNLMRDPRWGRSQEAYSEDPYLTARLGVAFIKGLQGDDPKYIKTVATPKHFAMHSQETGRTSSSFNITERTLRDYYLPAFYASFTEGKALETMVAHNGINGVPCTANAPLLTDLLRKEWGFEGAIVTDWTAVTYLYANHHAAPSLPAAIAAALNAGVDVMCDPKPLDAGILQAVKSGLLKESLLDRAATYNLTVRFRLGMFDPPEMVPFARTPPSVVGSKEHQALALQTARESMVLLHNEPAPPGYGFERILPLDLRRISSIAVLGPYAQRAQLGNYSGEPANPAVTPLEGLQAAVGPRVQVRTVDSERDEEGALKLARTCDVVIVVLGLNERMEAEGMDRATLDLPPKQREFLMKVVEANPITVAVLEGGGVIGASWIKEHVPAAIMAWYPGEQGGNALADVLLGRYNPAGRLPITFYRGVEDLPPLSDYEIDKGRTYMYLQKPAVYPFGHGLSYSTFTYRNLAVAPASATPTDTVAITCDVANTQGPAGDEVVQLYVHKTDSPLKRPLKQLKGFMRLTIPAGESRTVRFDLRMSDLAFWDVPAHKYLVEPGTYEILVGASSGDIRLRGSLQVK